MSFFYSTKGNPSAGAAQAGGIGGGFIDAAGTPTALGSGFANVANGGIMAIGSVAGVAANFGIFSFTKICILNIF